MQKRSQWFSVLMVSLGVAGLVGCSSLCSTNCSRLPSKESFGQTKDGVAVDLYTLRNANGAEARIMTYGGVVVSLKMPDRNDIYSDVVFGYDSLNGYLDKGNYFGALIGRYGNRIAKGQFSLAGKTYSLATNDGPNALHGGLKGFDKVVWQGKPLSTHEGQALQLTYVARDGEEGYPGNLTVTAVYTLTKDNALKLEYTATTDKPTVLNLTHHGFFNLAGKGDVLNHVVYIKSDKFTPVDSTLIPTGELRPVAGTPFDFNTPTAIGARIGQDDQQLKFGHGYDHNWVITKPAGKLSLMARVSEASSGRVMEVYSTEPALQFYTGNFLDGSIVGKKGWAYPFRSALCLEPQHYPDSPNHPEFPTTELKPGQTYKNTILYKFLVQK